MRAPSPLRAALFAIAIVCARASVVHAQANESQLFDAGRWPEAAVALHDAVHKQGASTADKELAQYRLAIALYRMGLQQPAYALFSEIADRPNHSKFNETLLWLATLLSLIHI